MKKQQNLNKLVNIMTIVTIMIIARKDLNMDITMIIKHIEIIAMLIESIMIIEEIRNTVADIAQRKNMMIDMIEEIANMKNGIIIISQRSMNLGVKM